MNHGTLTAYTVHRCRCEQCRRVHGRYQKQWRLRRQQGIPTMMPAEPLRQHVQQLLDQGMSFRGIALTAGYTSRNALASALTRDRVMPKTYHRIMGVTVDKDARRFGYVDSTGSARRLQALMAIGWTARELAVRMGGKDHGTCLDIANHNNNSIRRDTAQRIRDIYDELWNQPGPSRLSAQRAAKRGWLPPLAWDDDTIDDPAAQPHVVDDLRASGGGRPMAYVLEDFEDTRDHHQGDIRLAAERLGMSWAALSRALLRANNDGAGIAYHNVYKSGRAA